MPDLDAILREVWPRVRQKHLFPELPPPVFHDGLTNVALDGHRKQIRLSRAFVEAMGSALAPDQVIEALLDHGLSHHRYCPWDLVTHLLLYAQARKIMPEPMMARTAADMFMDIAADTRCVSEVPTPLANLYRLIDAGTLWDIQRATCQRLWEMDLGVKEHADIAGRLCRLAYLDRHGWPKAMKRFAVMIEPYLKSAPPAAPPLGGNGLGAYGSEHVRHGLRELAGRVSGPGEFKRIIEGFEEELAEAGQRPGQGAGQGIDALQRADVLYYMKLAENYRLPVTRRRLAGQGADYPHHHRPWEVSHPYKDIDPWTSLGKILPGITQTWRHQQGRLYGSRQRTPDCLVIIDSSSSMVNPRLNLSHAVLGAACACDAYLARGCRVGVYNFGDAAAGASLALPFGTSRRAAYEAICLYHGGGTRLGVEHVRALAGTSVPDLFLITDMQIANLAELLDYFKVCPNRVTVVHLGENDPVRRLQRSAGSRAGLCVHAVKHKKDIARIILGQVHDRFLAAPGNPEPCRV